MITRESDASHPAVISVGRMSAGTVHNAIAGYAEMEGIIRITLPTDSQRIMDGLRRIARNTGEAFVTLISTSIFRPSPIRQRVCRLHCVRIGKCWVTSLC